MSSRICGIIGYMSPLLSIVALLFSATLVRSDQTIDSLKSFKLSESITYDCIDIYKQPSLDHPLLKDHKIQMKPSVSISGSEIKNQTTNRNTYKKKFTCPDGTVPILRNSKEHLSNAHRLEEMHINPLQAAFPVTHVSGVKATKGPYRGVQAWFNVYELDIAQDQASYAAIFLGTETNYIQAGWMINPSLFGDNRVWTYGFWRGKNGNGCYNLHCPGFVQVSKDRFIAFPNDYTPYVGWFRMFIHQDPKTGNWWITELEKDKPSVDIGYWPKELFDLLSNGAQMVGVGGFTQASPSGSSPPMGNGRLPNGDSKKSAIFTNVDVLDHNYQQQRIDSTHVDVLLDSQKCYGIKYGDFKYTHLGFYFNYGGPGGTSC